MKYIHTYNLRPADFNLLSHTVICDICTQMTLERGKSKSKDLKGQQCPKNEHYYYYCQHHLILQK